MFVAKKLIFLELQKTGGSHILDLLSSLTEGESQGKHNRLREIDLGDRLVVGSVRNPWDWYVSLWAYGVSGRGALRYRTCKGIDPGYYFRHLPRQMGKRFLSPYEFTSIFGHDLIKPVSDWAGLYLDSESVEQFQSWLKMILSPRRRFDVGEGYAFSPMSRHAGFMTYRYLRLYTVGKRIFCDKSLANYSGLVAFDRKYNIANKIIRNESLEEDFIAALNIAGYELVQDQIDEIRSGDETNASRRNSAGYYYDDETLALVADRERLIIEKYSYYPPDLAAMS